MLRRPGWGRRGRYSLPLAAQARGPYGEINLADPRWDCWNPHKGQPLNTLTKMLMRYKSIWRYPPSCPASLSLEYVEQEITLLTREIDYRHKRQAHHQAQPSPLS